MADILEWSLYRRCLRLTRIRLITSPFAFWILLLLNSYMHITFWKGVLPLTHIRLGKDPRISLLKHRTYMSTLLGITHGVRTPFTEKLRTLRFRACRG